jgi:hypothetical protein
LALDDLGFALKEPKGRNGRLLAVVDGKAFPSLLVAPYWVEHHCIVPDGFKRGQQFELVKWQATAYLNHYRLKPTARIGQLGPAFHNSKSMVVLPQKAGKAPFSASRICLEGVGPALFAGWAKGGELYDCRDHGCGCGWVYEYQPGEAMGMRWPTPLIQITATSEDQTGNIYTALRPMIDDGPLSVLIPHTGENFIRLPNNGRIDPVTSNGRSRLGQRVTAVEWDEPGLYLRSNKMYGFSEAVYDTQDRGVTAMGGRGTLTTNAWDPSQDSAAKQVAKEAAENDDVYVLHPMAPSGLRYRVRAERHKIHKHVYRDCPWIDLDAIEGLAAKLAKRDPGQAERFYGNNPVAGQGVAFDVEQIKKLAAPKQVRPFATVVLGADGARFRDAMVVRACEVKTGYRWTVGVWERPKDASEDYEHPRDLIDGAVREVFENFNVWEMLVDPQYIDYLLAGWQHDYGDRRVTPWYTNRPNQMCWAVRHHAQEIASSLSVFEETGKPGDYSHDGSPEVMAHFANARKRPETIQDDKGAFMHTLSKEHAHSELFIDGVIADILVNVARARCIKAGAGDDPESPTPEPQKPQKWQPGKALPMGSLIGAPSQAGPMGSMS